MRFWELMSSALRNGTMSKMELIVMLGPSLCGVHSPERAILFDSMLPIFSDYLNRNGHTTFVRTKEVKSVLSGKKATARMARYVYHGIGNGSLNGYFTDSDPYSYISSEGGGLTVSSVSAYNLGHFFCDILDTDDKARDFAEWLDADKDELLLFRTIAEGLVVETRNQSK